MCALVRRGFEYKLDIEDGYFKYFNKTTGQKQLHKPLLLRNHPWDPDHIPSWTVDEVVLFFRRIGFKAYVRYVYDFKIDGKTLLLLDDDDFQFINIYNKLHIKKIAIEIERRYPMSQERKQKVSALKSEYRLRRQALERTQFYIRMAKRIQRNFRLYLQRKESRLQEELCRIREHQAKALRETQLDSEWWLERYSKVAGLHQRKNHVSYLKELQRLRSKSVQNNQLVKLGVDVWVPLSDSKTAEQ